MSSVPDLMIDRYGADATRMYALFAAPPDRDLDWQEDGVAGVSRFLARVYRVVTTYAGVAAAESYAPKGLCSADEQMLLRKLHQTIAKVSQDFGGRWHLQYFGGLHHDSGKRNHGTRGGDRVGADSGRRSRVRCCAVWSCCWRHLRLSYRRSCGQRQAAVDRCFARRGRSWTRPWRARTSLRFRCR